MQSEEVFDDDEIIHHRGGKVRPRSCPGDSHVASSRLGSSSPIILQSITDITTSPPARLPASAHNNEGQAKNCRLKKFFKKFFKHKQNPTYVVNIVKCVNYEVKELNVIDNCTIFESTDTYKKEKQ